MGDVEKLNKFMVASLLNAANIAIPRKHKSKNYKKSLPDYILLLIKKRKYYRKKAKQKDIDAKREYNHLTKIIREEIAAFKNLNWEKFIEKQGKNPVSSKPFWQKINKLRGNNSSNSIPSIKKDGLNYEKDEDEDKADLFASLLKKNIFRSK